MARRHSSLGNGFGGRWCAVPLHPSSTPCTSSPLSPPLAAEVAWDRALLTQRTARWDDLIDFEVIPVVMPAEAAATVAPRL